MKVNPEELVKLKLKGWTHARIAQRYGCSRAAISHYLRRQRTRTNKPRIIKACLCGCGVQTVRRKYASRECYFRSVCQRPYVSWRQGQRIARRVVARLFKLKAKHIVHHVDRDCRHNDPLNLWVFASHADHMSHHRGGLARPIWRGDGKMHEDPRINPLKKPGGSALS